MRQKRSPRRQLRDLWIALAVGTAVFGVMAVLQVWEPLAFDRAVYRGISSLESPAVTLFFKGVTFLGDTTWFIVLCLGLLLLVRPRWRGGLFVLNALLAGGANQGLKRLFERARPDDNPLITVGGFSFPSGHSMGAMAIYGMLIYAVWHTAWSFRRKAAFTAALSCLILLVGISRIYLGVHFASDVLAGFGAGLASLSLFLLILTGIQRRGLLTPPGNEKRE